MTWRRSLTSRRAGDQGPPAVARRTSDRRSRNGIPVVPQVFFGPGPRDVVKSLPGLLAVLRDGGYHDTEILRWLFTADPSLTSPGTACAGPSPTRGRWMRCAAIRPAKCCVARPGYGVLIRAY